MFPFESLALPFENLTLPFESPKLPFESLTFPFKSFALSYESVPHPFESLTVSFESPPFSFENLTLSFGWRALSHGSAPPSDDQRKRAKGGVLKIFSLFLTDLVFFHVLGVGRSSECGDKAGSFVFPGFCFFSSAPIGVGGRGGIWDFMAGGAELIYKYQTSSVFLSISKTAGSFIGFFAPYWGDSASDIF